MSTDIILYDRIWLRRSLLLMRNEGCTNSHLWENPLNWIVKWFTANRKAFLIDSPGRAWIEPHDTAGNGRAAYMTWMAHYNGVGQLSKQMAIVKTKLDNLHYRNGCSMSVEQCTENYDKVF